MNARQYWLNIRNCGWLEVSLLEYRRAERTAQLTGARLTGAPEINSFCYTKDRLCTQGRIVDPAHQTDYRWDADFYKALHAA